MMNAFSIVGEFLLVEWMWSVTWGIPQAPLAWCFLSLLLWLYGRLGFIRAVLSSLLVTVLSFLIFSACIIIGLGILAYTPAPQMYEYALSGVRWESFIGYGLAGIFSLLQIVLLRYVHRYAHVSMLRLAFLVLIANGMAALLTRAFLLTP